MTQKELLEIADTWFETQGWSPFPFQVAAWKAYLSGYSGLVNAPTGTGKTYSLWMAIMLEHLKEKARRNTAPRGNPGIQAIWITPIRALTKEIAYASKRLTEDLGVDWEIAVRTGDTPTKERTRQKRNPPQLLITTPETLHLLLAQKNYAHYFRNLKAMVVDEWHELLGSKRGVQVELALSRLKKIVPKMKIWGISATIGNMDEAKDVLLGSWSRKRKVKIIRSKMKKQIEVISILPDEIETMPWGGHLGISLLDKILPIIHQSKSTLVFTNTRSQAEIWYHRFLDADPDLAGVIAMHHGSISKVLRNWVEEALHEEQLKAVVCTSSLDLGVDFRPVETIIQIGGPKGVSRFVQRAGRSGHQPGALSRIYFVPTHSLELIEASALRQAIKANDMESRIPYIRSFDVLIQYLITLAVSDGFDPDEIFHEVKSTFCYSSLQPEEWIWMLNFITQGGNSLHAYDEFHKVIIDENGIYRVIDRRIALRHRLSIGTIVSDVMLTVKYVTGGRLGSVEEYFVAKMKPGDVFWFAGRSLELVRIKDMTVQVRKSNKKTGRIPAWGGGRMPLTSRMSAMLRLKVDESKNKKRKDIELKFLQPLLKLQSERSYIPDQSEFLVEYFPSKSGHHLMMYPFEGRLVHEVMGALMGYRIGKVMPISFSIGMNDYGFELLSDQEIPIEELINGGLLSDENLMEDVRASINSAEMAGRKFRDIASISGLIFQGYPGKPKKDRHIQSSSGIFFKVFGEHEPDNLLLRQAFNEVMDFHVEEIRFVETFKRISRQSIVVKRPPVATPFAFPIMVESIREKITNERIEDRVRKMQLQFTR